MCFIRTSKHINSDLPKTVYKIMILVNSHTVTSMHYHPNVRHTIGSVISASVDIPTEDIDKSTILEGEVVHAYLTWYWAQTHALYLRNIFSTTPLAVVECQIPAGTPYWINNNACEVVAKEMKILNIYY